MHKHVLSGIFAGFVLMAGSAAAAPQVQVQQPAGDEHITARVHERLSQEATLAPENIVISTRNGIVHMEGKVPSADAAKRAIHLAEATEGVRGVWVNFEAEE